jgi:hypothetical protein
VSSPIHLPVQSCPSLQSGQHRPCS